LIGFHFVFISIDDPKAKKPIVDFLIRNRIPFIDAGMDLSMDQTNSIRGKCRITLGTPEAADHIPHAINFGDVPENDLYRNVQVADLNMLNAALAVIKWKKTLGFYADDPKEHLAIYTVHTNGIAKEVCR
jgi:hypothetical protein